jgi:NTP pyrophosphatase (non-canonical NTP hydrolase)
MKEAHQREALVHKLGIYLADLAQALCVSIQIADQQDNGREGKWFPVVTVSPREWEKVMTQDATSVLGEMQALINTEIGVTSMAPKVSIVNVSSATSPEHAQAIADQINGAVKRNAGDIGAAVVREARGYLQSNGHIVSEAEFDAIMQALPENATDLAAKPEMFTRVSEMNEFFGNPKGDMSNIDWDRIESQVKCIPEEVEEALAAIRDRDLPALRDALCDIPVFSLGAQHLAGIDGAADMDIVIDANMTRLITNADQLSRTTQKYAAMGLATYVVGEFPTMALKSAKDQSGATTGSFFPKDKFLKCVDFKEPVFDMPAQQTLPLDETFEWVSPGARVAGEP